MSNAFFDRPILNSPYELPRRHWELDSAGQPTQQIIETRNYIPDFIVRVDDGHGPDDLLNLIVEIKGYRGEDAKEKNPPWTPTGCPVSTTSEAAAAGPLPNTLYSNAKTLTASWMNVFFLLRSNHVPQAQGHSLKEVVQNVSSGHA